jgi:hypothetical protein
MSYFQSAAIAVGLAWVGTSVQASAQSSMYIQSCGLGCSSGAGGTQVSCGVTSIHEDEVLRIKFSRPIDPASVHLASINIVNVMTGAHPTGQVYVDWADPTLLVFLPTIAFDAAVDPVYGFEPNQIYRVTIQGTAQLDPGPFVMSTDVPPLPNESRMQCDVFTNLGAGANGSVLFCAGDGSGTPCPCANNGTFPRGCGNSIDPQGAVLEAFGNPSLFFDALILRGKHMPNASVLYFQGTTRLNGGAGIAFGDGLRCAGGTVVRIATLTNINGASLYPSLGGENIALRGQVATPGTRTYQAWYRNAASFCTSATFNLTNGVEVTWIP